MPSNNEDKSSLITKVAEFELPKAIGGRALKVATDLIGNFGDKWNADLEDKPKKIRAKTDREIKQTDKIDDALTDRLLSDEPFMQRLAANKKKQWIKEQKNVEKICDEALELLPDMEVKDDNPKAEVADDWIEKFRGFASKVSDEDIQVIWSKLLAGEISKPGRFSFRTMSLISLIDKETADIISKYVNHNFGGNLLRSGEDGKGALNKELLELEHLGIVAGASGLGLQYTINLSTQKKAVQLTHEGTVYGFNFENDVGELKFNSILLTRVGEELATLLPKASPEELRKRFSEQCLTEGLLSVSVLTFKPLEF